MCVSRISAPATITMDDTTMELGVLRITRCQAASRLGSAIVSIRFTNPGS
jgi:hypothetical protein